jgi:hypothetical protein
MKRALAANGSTYIGCKIIVANACGPKKNQKVGCIPLGARKLGTEMLYQSTWNGPRAGHPE